MPTPPGSPRTERKEEGEETRVATSLEHSEEDRPVTDTEQQTDLSTSSVHTSEHGQDIDPDHTADHGHPAPQTTSEQTQNPGQQRRPNLGTLFGFSPRAVFLPCPQGGLNHLHVMDIDSQGTLLLAVLHGDPELLAILALSTVLNLSNPTPTVRTSPPSAEREEEEELEHDHQEEELGHGHQEEEDEDPEERRGCIMM